MVYGPETTLRCFYCMMTCMLHKYTCLCQNPGMSGCAASKLFCGSGSPPSDGKVALKAIDSVSVWLSTHTKRKT